MTKGILFKEKNILICFGTRPEYIKVRSLIDNIKRVKIYQNELKF